MNTQIKRATFELDVGPAVPSGDAMTVTVTGEIDVTNAPDFARSIDQLAARRTLVLDLRRLRFLDSAGFAVLYRFLQRRAIVVVLAADSPIHTAATLIGLPYHESVEAALGAR
jgi:anti-anti-sigma factor